MIVLDTAYVYSGRNGAVIFKESQKGGFMGLANAHNVQVEADASGELNFQPVVDRIRMDNAQVGVYFAIHSRAMTSKLLAARLDLADFVALRCSPGSTPAANCLRASSRRSRASFSPTSGYVPNDKSFSLPS